MSSNIHAHTPAVTVLDNRGLTVRTIGYHRHPETPDVTDERITRHQFDARGHLVTSIDPRLFARQQHDKTVKPNVSYLTNLTGDVIRTESPDAGITVSLSDIARRPHWSKNAVGALQTWQYEADTLPGRLLSVTEQPQGESARITERVVYAGHNENEKAQNLAGQAVRHYDTAGLTQTDSLALTGTPLAVTRQLLPEGTPADWQGTQESAWQTSLSADIFTTHSTADATGATLTHTDAKGHQQRLTYDVAGLLTESGLTLKGQPEQIILKSLTWSAAGQKLREAHGNGVVTTYRYEPETQRLTAIKTERPTGHVAGAKVLQDLRYTYDPVGNVLRILDEAEPTRFWQNQKVVPENTYTYDSLYQLVTATGREKADIKNQGIPPTAVSIPLATDNTAYTTWTRSYTYDNGNNLTRIRHHAPASGNTYTTEITVSHRSNRAVLSLLTKDPAQVDSLFDAGGHQTQLQKGQPITWTARGELLKVMPVVRDEQADDAETYRYDATSQRVIKTTVQQTGNSRQTQRVVYLPNLELRTTHRGEKLKEALQVITVGEAGRAQVRVLHWEAGKPDGLNNNQLRYSYDNLIGSSTLELDGMGEIISQEEYYPYGGTAVWTARNQTEADYKTLRYSGKERDATGLYYYGYRYYQPWVGRWLSADPAGTVDGLNLFKMSGNNPITMHDKKGLSPDKYNMYSMKEETTRIFRVEVKNFNPRFGHVFIENSNARIYFPEEISMGALSNPEIKLSTYYTGKLTSDIGVSLSYTSTTESNIVKIYFHEPYMSLFDKKGMSDYEYSRGYLTMNDKAPLGTMGWLNLNNPNRALKLYEQKKNNPNEKEEFVIKSFDIPSGVF
uniref:RHS repeat protein n=1 Tax=Candidatus Williamhamiltonella defendens TaxID=138072 RepID=UPI0015836CB5